MVTLCPRRSQRHPSSVVYAAPRVLGLGALIVVGRLAQELLEGDHGSLPRSLTVKRSRISHADGERLIVRARDLPSSDTATWRRRGARCGRRCSSSHRLQPLCRFERQENIHRGGAAVIASIPAAALERLPNFCRRLLLRLGILNLATVDCISAPTGTSREGIECPQVPVIRP
jgi:hypothetical protein